MKQNKTEKIDQMQDKYEIETLEPNEKITDWFKEFERDCLTLYEQGKQDALNKPTLSKVFQFEEGIREGKAQAIKEVLEIIKKWNFICGSSFVQSNIEELKSKIQALTNQSQQTKPNSFFEKPHSDANSAETYNLNTAFKSKQDRTADTLRGCGKFICHIVRKGTLMCQEGRLCKECKDNHK